MKFRGIKNFTEVQKDYIIVYAHTHTNFEVMKKFKINDQALGKLLFDRGFLHRVQPKQREKLSGQPTKKKISPFENASTESLIEAMAKLFEERVQDKKTIAELKEKVEALIVQNRRLWDGVSLHNEKKANERLERARTAMVEFGN